MLIKKVDTKHKFVEMFNSVTGFYLRSGIIDENGKDTGVDPFMGSFPSLIDVGIMGSCVHGLTGHCKIGCYQNGPGQKAQNMKLDDWKRIVDEAKGKVFQIALGGRGDPNKHENFKEIVEYARLNFIAPNYTTSGFELTDEEITATKQFCGSVAVSDYRHPHTYEAVKRFIAAGVTTNIHYILSAYSVEEATERLKKGDWPDGINAVIFLLHKPVGLGSQKAVLKRTDPRLINFWKLIDQQKFKFQVGFDSCTVPGLLNYTNNIDFVSVDTCEAARWSMYITSDMKAHPCSFDNQGKKWEYDMTNDTIQNAWNSEIFENFRDGFRKACPSCKIRTLCYGGCQITPEITLCSKEEHKEIPPNIRK